jgi:hypothetical protein
MISSKHALELSSEEKGKYSTAERKSLCFTLMLSLKNKYKINLLTNYRRFMQFKGFIREIRFALRMRFSFYDPSLYFIVQ